MSLEDPTPPLIIWQLCDCHDSLPLPSLTAQLPPPPQSCCCSSSIFKFLRGIFFQLKGQQTERQKVIE